MLALLGGRGVEAKKRGTHRLFGRKEKRTEKAMVPYTRGTRPARASQAGLPGAPGRSARTQRSVQTQHTAPRFENEQRRAASDG